jgi:anti-sigma28 factor (negative regulator of flagellin synthesis)
MMGTEARRERKGMAMKQSMLNVSTSHADLLQRYPQEFTRYTFVQKFVDETHSSREESIAYLQTQLLARSDGEARIAHVAMLKAQIEAGSYRVDSNALAQKMLKNPFMHHTCLPCAQCVSLEDDATES